MALSNTARSLAQIALSQQAFSFSSVSSEQPKLRSSTQVCFSFFGSRRGLEGLQLRGSSKTLVWQRCSTRAGSVSTEEEKLSSLGETAGREEASGEETGVVIVGAGLAGLAAARQLAQANVPFLLLDASDGVGGRVRTDTFRGFQLDRGFQLLLSGYPETREVLDYDALKLHNFYAGALVKLDSGFHRMADPFRHPADGLSFIFNEVGTPLDKILVGIVRLKATLRSVDEILAAEEVSSLQRLQSEGFSTSMIDRFFRPFFGGVFFDKELATTSRLFDFIFRAFALGANALPASGMGAISEQLAASLPQGSVRLNSKVKSLVVQGDSSPAVKLQNGAVIKSRHGVVVAVEGPEAARLLGSSLEPSLAVIRPPRHSITLYFSADKPPHPEPVLFLNGSGKGVVNSVVVISNVAPSYAPPGKSLISVSLIVSLDRDEGELEQVVRRELGEWFGPLEVGKWEHLRTYKIAYGQPNQEPPTNLAREVRLGAGLYVCGDHRDHATTHGALVSGKRAAQALLADVKVSK